MADIDDLPKRGIPFRAIVDAVGVAVGGTLTVDRLRQRGMRPVCEVDATGVGGATVDDLRRRGIEYFCVVDENGLTLDESATIEGLRRKGISAICPIGADGVAQGGTATIEVLRRRGINFFCPLDEDGNETPVGDATAPVLSAPDVDLITETTAHAHVTTNEGNGTWYGVITNNTTVPTDDQIIAGQDHTGGAAAFAPAGQAVSSTGVKTFDATGLTASQQYWFYAIHVDAAGNRSNITDYGPFSTSAAGIGAVTLAWDGNGATGLRPVFTASGLVAAGVEVGDVINAYLQDSDDVTFTLYKVSAAIQAGDLVTDSIVITGTDPVAEDGWQAHARTDRAGSLGDISNEVNFVVALPATPSLVITTPVTDNTPGGTFSTDDLIEGDTAEVQYDTVATFDNDPQTLQNVIDATEDAANTFTFATTALADGTWHFRPRVVRLLYGPSAYGTSDSITIDATAPTVSSFSPLDNATGVAIDATLVATFAETVTLGTSGVITLKKTSDNTTVDSWDVATDGGSGAGQVEVLTNTALTLHQTSNFPNSTGVYVVWDAGVVKDVAGNNVAALSTTTTWSFTTVSAVNLLDGLISFWELEEATGTRVDAHGTNDLADSGLVGQTTGKVGNCATFVGTNPDLLSCAEDAGLASHDKSFSIAAWLYWGGAGDTDVITKGSAFGQTEWQLRKIFSGTQNFLFKVNQSDGQTADAGVVTGTISTATWYLVVCTYNNSTKDVSISLNAGTRVTATASSTIKNTTGDFRIGNQFSGRVDQAGFWNRVLTEAEEDALYNAGNGLTYSAL